MRTEEARVVRLQDYRPPDWLIDTVELDISLHPTATRVHSRLRLRPNPQGGSAAPVALDGEDLLLRGVKVNGAALPSDAYAVTPDRLVIAQPPNAPFELEIETEISPSANTQLMGLYRSNETYCTQCEAEGFRRITYFLDRPDVMAVYTTRIEAEQSEAPVLLSNGNLVESGPIPGSDRHYAVWHDPFPKPCYLFALVGGDLACVEDRFTTASGRDVALRIYVEHGHEERCGYAMDALKRSMRWDEQAFGREYDLDVFMIVAVSAFNMGAMENKGLNIFNDKYVLATPETATDSDYASIEAIIAHEYFHNWTGNRITCRDWFQLCLKEGLTVFRDQEFSATERSVAVERISDVRALRAHQFIEDAGPLAHPVRPDAYREINNFYTSTVYEKGAEIIRMLKVLLGPEHFRAGMDLYFERHDGRAATVEDFIACFAEVSARDLGQFMLWYQQSGTPRVVVSGKWDERTKTYRLDLSQQLPPTPGQPNKEPMVIPCAIGLLDESGREMPLVSDDPAWQGRGVLEITQVAQSCTFHNVPSRPIASLNRSFSAPINVSADLSAEDLGLLAAHDTDAFNRWQAVQTLALRLLVENTAKLRGGAEPAVDGTLIAAMQAALAHPALEPAFIALVLTLPLVADIAREIGNDVDPDAVYAARTHLRSAVGSALREALHRTYAALHDAGPYSPDAQSSGRRSLKNACLDLLAAGAPSDGAALAIRQYETANNMTDRMAALSTLVLNKLPEKETAIEGFYARYKDDPLVLDKWFALQASVADRRTLDRVHELMQHPAFSFGNPNRIRALIGTFGLGNATEFNRPDGAGYAFVIDQVIALDERNPQVAARLMGGFKNWRVLEAGRRGKAEAALRRLAGREGLSTDVADLVERALGDPRPAAKQA